MRFSIVSTLLLVALERGRADDPPKDSENIADSTAAGKSCWKASSGKFLRGRDFRPNVPFNRWTLEVVDECDSNLQWYIEYFNKKVMIKPEWSTFDFLIANEDASVALERYKQMWTPLKDEEFFTVKNSSDSSRNFMLESRNEFGFYASITDGYDGEAANEAAGTNCIKSAHDSYLRTRSRDGGFRVYVDLDLSPRCKACEHWSIESDRDKVFLKPVCPPRDAKAFLSANKDGSVFVKFTFGFANEKWKPYKNEDGTWSFQSAHGTWLRVEAEGKYSLMTNPGPDARFRLESFEDPTVTTATITSPDATKTSSTEATGTTTTTTSSSTTTEPTTTAMSTAATGTTTEASRQAAPSSSSFRQGKPEDVKLIYLIVPILVAFLIVCSVFAVRVMLKKNGIQNQRRQQEAESEPLEGSKGV